MSFFLKSIESGASKGHNPETISDTILKTELLTAQSALAAWLGTHDV